MSQPLMKPKVMARAKSSDTLVTSKTSRSVVCRRRLLVAKVVVERGNPVSMDAMEHLFQCLKSMQLIEIVDCVFRSDLESAFRHKALTQKIFRWAASAAGGRETVL